ncbi:MAG: hypothetical protein AAB089_07520 [Nitrospirota bacterium]
MFVIPAPYQVRDKLQQESRKTKENTGFPLACPVGRLNTCGNDGYRTYAIKH